MKLFITTFSVLLAAAVIFSHSFLPNIITTLNSLVKNTNFRTLDESGSLLPYWDNLSTSPPMFVSLNGALVMDRMQAYKWIIEATNGAWPTDNNLNIHWGYALQLNWQWKSGRLNEVLGSPTIGKNSWFGGVNYYLSILPFLGAVEAGLFQNTTSAKVLLTPPLECGAKHCEKDVKIQNLIMEWRDYFKMYLNATGETSSSGLQKMCWIVHANSLHLAVENLKHLRVHAPQFEWYFGEGWARFTRVLAYLNIPTDFYTTYFFQTFLPGRVVDVNLFKKLHHIVSLPTVWTCIMSYFLL